MHPILPFLIAVMLLPGNIFGYTYEYFSDGLFTSIHTLVINPKEHPILPVKAKGQEVQRETVAALASQYGALGGINGGFWKLDGTPAGILKINNQWYGTPQKPRGAIGWSHQGQKVVIDRVLTIETPENDIQVIPVSDPPNTTEEEWQQMEHIVGGTPVLIAKGCLIEDYTPEQTLLSFLIEKHPRTAVGIKDDGDWIFVVADGSLYGLLGGMTIHELALFMLSQGCVEALNLDGGGSSTMVLNGKVVNNPCGDILENGKYVEAVSDAILLFSFKSKIDLL